MVLQRNTQHFKSGFDEFESLMIHRHLNGLGYFGIVDKVAAGIGVVDRAIDPYLLRGGPFKIENSDNRVEGEILDQDFHATRFSSPLKRRTKLGMCL